MARPAPDQSTRKPAWRPAPRPPRPRRHLFGWVALGVACFAVVAVAFAFTGNGLEPTPINPPGVGSAGSPSGAPTAPRRWRSVITVSGSTSKRTPAFALHGVQTRLRYSVEAPDGQSSPNATIYVRAEGADAATDAGAPAVTATQAGSDDARLQRSPGNYYLDVQAANANWSVAIEEYR